MKSWKVYLSNLAETWRRFRGKSWICRIRCPLHLWSQIDEALSRWLNLLAGDLLQELEPAIRALFVFLQSLFLFPGTILSKPDTLRRAAVEELFRIHFLSVRTQQKIDEQ